MRWIQSVLPIRVDKCEHCGQVTSEYSELLESAGLFERVVARGCPDCLEAMK